MQRIVILVSGRGSNAQAILQACAAEGWPARVVAVVSNRPGAAALEAARKAAAEARAARAAQPGGTGGRSLIDAFDDRDSAPPAAAVCAPYQKQATTARTRAGMFAPKVPKDARASTGNGTPVRTPALPTIDISTKITSEPAPMAMTKFRKLPHSKKSDAAR